LFANHKFVLKRSKQYVICSVESRIMHFGLAHLNCIITQKPSKQHRFDCLASKLYISRVAHLNWVSYLWDIENKIGAFG